MTIRIVHPLFGSTSNSADFTINALSTFDQSLSFTASNQLNLIYSFPSNINSGIVYYAIEFIIQKCPIYCSNCSSDATTCVSCISGYFIDNSLCSKCDSNCLECSGVSTNCTSCPGGQYLYNYTCVQACPNGYQINNTGMTCDLCDTSSLSLPACNTCNITCKQCQLGQTSSTSCTSCYPTKGSLQSDKSCKCNNSNDQRNNFWECSSDNVAVLVITLSDTIAELDIDFGAPLNSIGSSSTPSSSLCVQIFDSPTIDLLNNSSLCSIVGNLVVVTLNNNSEVMQGDTLTLNQNVLSYTGSSVTIDTFYFNTVSQKDPGTPSLIFSSSSVVNSCNDIVISLTSITNDAKRGFKSFTWSILSYSVTPSADQQSEINQLISNANTNQIDSLDFRSLLIPTDSTILVQFSYQLKVNKSGLQQFSILYKKEKMIAVSYYQSRYPPIYKYQDLSLYVSYTSKICDLTGIISVIEPVNVQIASTQVPLINKYLSNLADGQFEIDIPKYTMPSNQAVLISMTFTLSSNTNLSTVKVIEIDVQITNLLVSIVGGGQQIVDFSKSLTLNSNVRDYEVQDSTAPQLITLTWSCLNVATTDGICKDYNGNPVTLSQNVASNTFAAREFIPYTVLKFTLQGNKDSRMTKFETISIFSELDIPVLTVLTSFDQENQLINLNEDLTFTLKYDSSYSSDILSYAGAILYNNNVEGTIKFDYFVVRIRIWDYFQSIQSNNNSLQIRFSIYNPQFVMPSLCTINININIPPTNCVFTVSPLSGISLTTTFTLTFSNCVDTKLPLTYQFFYYNSKDEFQQELVSPWNIVRRQIQDQSNQNVMTTILPSGNLLLLAQVMDNQLGVYNATQLITVSTIATSEDQYFSQVNQLITSSFSLLLRQQVINLSILGEDVSKQTQFSSSSVGNQSKLSLITSLQTQSALLPSYSLLSTFANKIITSLQGSLQVQTSQSSILQQIQGILTNQQQSTQAGSSSQLQSNNNFITQNLVDSFKLLNSTTAFNITNTQSFYDTYDNISTTIGVILNNNSIPNQGSVFLQGNLLNLTSDLITQKNLYKYARQMDTSTAASTTQILSVVQNDYAQNIYQNTTDFQNYTAQLQKTIPNLVITQNPLISPRIVDQQTQKPLTDTFIFYDFPNANINKTSNMTCLQKGTNSWSKNECSLNKKTGNNYACICNQQSPTTITDYLDELFLNNKNLQTAFSSQGLTNIFNFTHPEEYAIFWIFISSTLLQVFLYWYGRKLDIRVIAQVYPETLLVQQPNENQNESPLISNQNNQEQPQIENDRLSLKNQTRDKRKSEFEEENIIKQNSIIKDRQKQQDMEIENLDIELNDMNKDTINIESKQQVTKAEVNSDKNIAVNSIEEVGFLNKKDRQVTNFGKETPMNEPQTESERVFGNYGEDPNSSIKLNSNQNIEKNNSLETYLQKPLLFKVILFHQFFGVFFIYDKVISRPIRFQLFYIKIIHSMAISVLFGSYTAIDQQIAVSIVNSIVIETFTFIILYTHKKGKTGKIASIICQLLVLLFYYYITLAVQSGKEPGESNKFIILFFVMIGINFVIVLNLIAFTYMLITKAYHQKKEKQLYNFLYTKLKIQDILDNVKY